MDTCKNLMDVHMKLKKYVFIAFSLLRGSHDPFCFQI